MAALGSLVVKLGLEYAQFTGGLDKSEQAALAASKKIQDTFDGMKRGIAATAGAVAGGLAAGFTVAAFKSLIGGAIETGAALDDLAMQTGSTVEALSGLAEVGKFNDMGPEKIGAAMNVLTRNLAGATEESKGAGAAIKALGLDMDKFRALKPEDQMQAVAAALDGVQDGAGKSAVMMALYGKEGAQMLPFMKDLASVGELQAKVTAEQAAAAAQLDDNWVKLTTTGSETAKEVAMGMVPAFDEAVRAAMDVMAGTGGMREMLRGLVSDGSIKQWTTDAIKGLSYVADAGQIAWRVLQSIGKGLGGLAAALVQALQGDFRGAWSALKESGQDMIDTFDGPTIGARFRESLGKMAASADAAGDSAKKATLDFRNLGEGKGAKTAADAFVTLQDSVAKATAAYMAESAAGEKLTEGQKKAVDVLEQIRAGKVKVTQAQAAQIGKDIEAMLAAEGLNKAREEALKAAEAERAERTKLALAAEQDAAGLEASNRAMREEIELIGLTAEQQTVVLQQRTEAIILTKEATLAELERASAITGTMTREQIALQAEIEALKERNALLGSKSVKNTAVEAAKKAKDEWGKTTDQINQSLTDALMRGFESGKDFAKNLRDTVVNMFKTMVLRPVISAIVSPISGAITGALGLSGAAQAGQGASALSTIGSIGSGYSMLSALGGTFGGGLAAGFGGLTGSMGLAATGTTLAGAVDAGMIAMQAGNIAGGMGTLAGALGPIAIGIAALAAIFGKKATPHAGAASSYSEAGGLVSGADIYKASGLADVRTYNAGVEQVTGNVAKAIGDTLNATARTFGKTAGYEISTAFADDTSKDGAWGSLVIKQMGKEVLNWADTQNNKWAPKEFADGEAGSKEYLAAVAKSTRDALVQAVGSVDWAADMLTALGDNVTLESLSQTVQQIGAAKAAFVSFGQYMPTFAGLADSAVSKMVKASGGVESLAGGMAVFVDQFYSDAEKLAVNTDNVRAAMAKLGFELPTTRDEFRALVQAQMALGDAGADTAAGLLGLSGAFASIVPATDAVTDSIKAMTGSMDDYISKNVRDSAQASYLRGLHAVGNTSELKRLGIPGYASGGYHAGGVRLVGEDGPELEVTGPSHIISSPATAALLGGHGSDTATVTELKGLRSELQSEIKNLRIEVRAVVVQTAKTADIWERVTPGRNSISIATPYGPVQVAAPEGQPLSVDQVPA